MATATPLFLQVTRTGRRRKFGSAQEVAEWLEAERSAWGPLITAFIQAQNHYNSHRSLEAAAGGVIQAKLDQLTRRAQIASREQSDEANTQLIASFEQAYSTEILASDTGDGQFVLCANSNTEKAARFYALTNPMELAIPQNVEVSGLVIAGVAEGVVHRHNISRAAAKKAVDELDLIGKSHDEALTELRETQHQIFNSLVEEQKARLEQLYKLKEQHLNALHEDKKEILDQLHSEERERLELLHAKRSYALKTLTNSFRDAIHLANRQQADAQNEFTALVQDSKDRLAAWERQLPRYSTHLKL